MHIYTNNSFNVYVTQVKSREEKSYSIQSHFIFSSCASLFHHIFLCAMNDNHWVKEHSSMYVTIMSITNAKKTSFVFESRIESKHHCIEYHQWRAEQTWYIVSKFTVSMTLKLLYSRRAILFLREFCSFI